jgi:hypothetical protein
MLQNSSRRQNSRANRIELQIKWWSRGDGYPASGRDSAEQEKQASALFDPTHQV